MRAFGFVGVTLWLRSEVGEDRGRARRVFGFFEIRLWSSFDLVVARQSTDLACCWTGLV